MNGDFHIRTKAAIGLGEVVKRTSAPSLKPFVTQITGPFIRVVGDRFPAELKTAILKTLGYLFANERLLLRKVPAALKPFLPQLQRTFCKSLSDKESDHALRKEASVCLYLLIPLQPRLDPLIVELLQILKTSDDALISLSVLEGLTGLLNLLGDERQISLSSTDSIYHAIIEILFQSLEQDSNLREEASKCFGHLVKSMANDFRPSKIYELITRDEKLWYRKQGKILAIAEVVNEWSEHVDLNTCVNLVTSSLTSDNAKLADSALKLAKSLVLLDSDLLDKLIPSLIKATQPGNVEGIRNKIILFIEWLPVSFINMKYLQSIVPALMVCIRERDLETKKAAESCLIKCLNMKNGMDRLDEYLKTLEKSQATIFTEFVKKLFAKSQANKI